MTAPIESELDNPNFFQPVQPIPPIATCAINPNSQVHLQPLAQGLPELATMSLLAVPLEINWLMFKHCRHGLKNFKIINTHVGYFGAGQYVTLVAFVKLNLTRGYVYQIKDICAWLEEKLGNTEMFYKVVNKEIPAVSNRTDELDPDLTRCLHLLNYWQQDNICATQNQQILNESSD
jgi:hypothetical protein